MVRLGPHVLIAKALSIVQPRRGIVDIGSASMPALFGIHPQARKRSPVDKGSKMVRFGSIHHPRGTPLNILQLVLVTGAKYAIKGIL